MTTRSHLLNLMRDYVVGNIDVKEFCFTYNLLWRAMRDSGRASLEEGHVQRGLDVVFTSIDAFETDVSDENDFKQKEPILYSAVRAVLSVLSP